MPKLTEARKKANKKWDENNKDRKNYIVKRSTTKNFILKSATEEDLKNIESYIIERKAKLKESKEYKKESHFGSNGLEWLFCLLV